MSSNTELVYCQILGDSISTSLCLEEQGQRGCRGCDAPCRHCTACKSRPSTNPKFGLCDACLTAAERPVKTRKERTPHLLNRVWRFMEASASRGEVPKPETFRKQEPSNTEEIEIEIVPALQAREETDAERWKRLMSDSVFRAWYDAVCMKDAKCIARTLKPIFSKPAPRVWCARCRNKPSEEGTDRCNNCRSRYCAYAGFLPIHPPAPIEQEEWVKMLLSDCWDAVIMGRQNARLVMHYRDVARLDPITLDRFEQDDRIVLLTAKRGKGKKAKHCLVFSSADEARFFLLLHDDEDALAYPWGAK